MPRHYQRKTDRDTASKPEQARRALKQAWDNDAKTNGWPKGFIVPLIHTDVRFQESLTRLYLWLRRLRKEPLAYSALLQLWLEDWMNLELPKDVFKANLNAKRKGRPSNYDLGRTASLLYVRGKFGYGRVAQQLRPDEYAEKPEVAIQSVKDGMATYRNHKARKRDASEEARDLVYQMLGVPPDRF